ncbi:zinc finger, CCHC-type containing protein [Tanacetum coccineum]
MNMDEAIQVSCIIDKLPLSWKDFKHTLKHKNEELTLAELGSHERIKESLTVQDSDKPKGNNVVGPSVVNMVEHNNPIWYNDNKGKCKHQDTKDNPNKKSKVTCWKCGKPGHSKKDCKGGEVGNKANGLGTNGSVNGSSNSLKGATVHVSKDRCWFKTSFMSISKMNDSILWHARLSHVHFKRMKDMPKDGLTLTFGMDTVKWQFIECILVGYVEHFKAFRLCVIEPNESVSINSIIKSRDVIFHENRFSSVPRPSQRTRDKVSDQHSYCLNVEDDPKTFDEAMKSQDFAF